MLCEVDSLQALMANFYFQERIAALDKEVLDDLHAKADALQQNKNQLGQYRRNKLGEIVSEFARKAVAFAEKEIVTKLYCRKLKQQRFYRKRRMILPRNHSDCIQINREIGIIARAAEEANAMGSGTATPIHLPVSPF